MSLESWELRRWEATQVCIFQDILDTGPCEFTSSEP